MHRAVALFSLSGNNNSPQCTVMTVLTVPDCVRVSVCACACECERATCVHAYMHRHYVCLAIIILLF